MPYICRLRKPGTAGGFAAPTGGGRGPVDFRGWHRIGISRGAGVSGISAGRGSGILVRDLGRISAARRGWPLGSWPVSVARPGFKALGRGFRDVAGSGGFRVPWAKPARARAQAPGEPALARVPGFNRLRAFGSSGGRSGARGPGGRLPSSLPAPEPDSGILCPLAGVIFRSSRMFARPPRRCAVPRRSVDASERRLESLSFQFLEITPRCSPPPFSGLDQLYPARGRMGEKDPCARS